MDIRAIREDFPILKRKINGHPVVYLDSGASSLKPKQVIAGIEEYYTQYGVNIFRGIYPLSEEATQKYEAARITVADFIGAKNPNEVIFVRNTTEAINLVCYSWGRMVIDKNCEILITVMEHHANLVPWQELARKTGAALKYIDITPDGYLDLEHFDEKITKKTKLLAVTQVSNVLGTVNPIKELVKRAKKINPKIKVLVDGAQSVPHMKVDVADLDCDFLAFSGHKMLGPTGIGVLWGRYEILDQMVPFMMGGDMINEVHLNKTTYKKPPHKFEAGTPDISGAVGLAAAVNYLSKIGLDEIRTHEMKLLEYAMKYLQSSSDITIYGPKNIKDRGGVIAFNIKGIHPHDVAQILADENICIRSGHHCAMPLHERLGIPASNRISFYIFTTKEDIDAFVSVTQRIRSVFA